MNEPLDFCRVKKINEKGFGFLKSLYYPKDIFFHFSQIKKEEFQDKLKKMKRGEFFLYFISKELPDGKRKAIKFWYSIEDVPVEYYEIFFERILKELNEGSTNVYDCLFAINELKNVGFINDDRLRKVFYSKKILALPSTILPYLQKNEIEEFKKIVITDEIKNSENKPYWYEDFEKV